MELLGGGIFVDPHGDSGQDTPVGFQDSPSHSWGAAAAANGGQKRNASGEHDSAATQLQGTLQVDDQATQPVGSETAAAPPVFVYAGVASEFDDGHQEEVDEEETQIRMASLSEDQEGNRPPTGNAINPHVM